MDVGMAMLESADAVFVCGERISTGMKEEILLAKEKNITIHSFHPEVSNEIDQLIGENPKHVRTSPGVTQKQHILANSPEKINGLRLDERELILPKQPISSVVQHSFERRFSQELNILNSYKDYRAARDAGTGAVLRTKDEQMLGIEYRITEAAKDAGMGELSIKEHIETYLNKHPIRKTRDLTEEPETQKHTRSR
jgi:hypothetical protein